MKYKRRKQNEVRVILLQILPRYDYLYEPDNMRMFLKTLSGVRKSKKFLQGLKNIMNPDSLLDYSFIIDCDGTDPGKISFYLKLAIGLNDQMVLNSLENLFHGTADVFERKELLPPYRTVHTLYTQEEKSEDPRQMKPTRKSLATFQDDKAFLYILASMSSYTRITLDFNVNTSTNTLHRFSGQRGITSEVEANAMIKVSGKTKYQRNKIMEISNTILNLTSGEKVLKATYKDIYRISTLNADEFMNLLQIPTFYKKNDQINDNPLLRRINKLEIGQRTLEEGEFKKGIKCGHVYHPMQNRDVFLDELQLRKHMFITGQTGSGKSSIAEDMMRDILLRKVKGEKKTPGFSMFDPAETSVMGIIDMILKLQADGFDITKLVKTVHYIDFSYEDYIFPISILNKNMPATEIFDYFKTLFGELLTIQVDRMLTSAINALLLDDKEHTILEVPELFLNEDIRQELMLHLKGDIYAADAISFLKGTFTEKKVDPILNRIDPFMNTPQKKLMFGMNSRYDGLRDIRKWFDDGHIILFNLKGLNDFDMKIIIGYIALKYYLIGLQRSDDSLLHLSFFDENHKTQFDIFRRWLAELRKGGMALIPMTQFLDQYDPNYLKALLGNVGTKISFRQGDDSARRLVANLPGNVDKEGLKALPDRLGYISTEDNRILKSVLVEVDPPYRYNDGKAVPFPDDSGIHKIKNEEKNRRYGRELMRRDFMKKSEAERIVFGKKIREYKKQDEVKKQEGDAEWDE